MTPPPPPPPRSSKVTDTQVAFLVECYLRDSRFLKTLHHFRSEAASVLYPLKSIPKSARTLSSILNEYVVLKEQHIAFDHEKARVDVLFKGLQDILSVYRSGGVEQMNDTIGFPSPSSAPLSVPLQPSSVSTPAVVPASVDVVSKESLSSGLCKRKCYGGAAPAADSVKRARRNAGGRTSSPSQPKGVLMQTDPNTVPDNGTRASMQPQSQIAASGSRTFSSPPTARQKEFVSPVRTNVVAEVAPVVSHSSSPDSCSIIEASSADPRTPSPLSVANSSAHHSMVQPSGGIPDSVSPSGSCLTRRSHRLLQSAAAAATSSGYSPRAHKKADSLSAATTPVISQSSSDPSKISSSRKKGTNSKCRLLDFSVASTSKDSSQGHLLHNGCPQLPSSTVAAHVNENCREVTSEFPSSSSSDDQQHSPEPIRASASEIPVSCDAVFFDDLFDVEIDTDLISQLEDLQPMNDIDGVLESASGCSGVEDTLKSWNVAAALSPSSREVLTDKANLLGVLSSREATAGSQETLTHLVSFPAGIKAKRVSAVGCGDGEEANDWGDKENRVPEMPNMTSTAGAMCEAAAS